MDIDPETHRVYLATAEFEEQKPGASGARSAVGRPERTTSGLVRVVRTGILSTQEGCAQPASINGLEPNVCRAPDGRRIPTGIDK